MRDIEVERLHRTGEVDLAHRLRGGFCVRVDDQVLIDAAYDADWVIREKGGDNGAKCRYRHLIAVNCEEYWIEDLLRVVY